MGYDRDGEYAEFVKVRIAPLRRLAYLLCGDGHRADDLVQETLVKLYVRWPSTRTVNNLDAYVRTILVRLHIDESRRPWSRVRLFGAVPDRPDAARSGVEDRTVLRAALASLPAGQRVVLVLRFLCDLSVAEASEVLGYSEGAVRSQTFHGLKKLRAALNPSDFATISRED